MAGLFIEFLVGKCAGCQSWKSDFGCIAFVFTLLDAGWKVPQAILALLYSFQFNPDKIQKVKEKLNFLMKRKDLEFEVRE